MVSVEDAHGAPGLEARPAGRHAREAVELASHEMAQRVAREGVEREEGGVEEQGERPPADADAEPAIRLREDEAPDHVVPEDDEDHERQVHEVAMQVLEDERELELAAVALALDLAHRAGGRIAEERPVVGLAVVVAGGAEAERRPQDQDGGRDRPPRGLEERRVEGREIVSELVVIALEGGPGGIETEQPEPDRLGQRLGPPGVLALGRAQALAESPAPERAGGDAGAGKAGPAAGAGRRGGEGSRAACPATVGVRIHRRRPWPVRCVPASAHGG